MVAWFRSARRPPPSTDRRIAVSDAAVRRRLDFIGLTDDDLTVLAAWGDVARHAIPPLLAELERRAAQAPSADPQRPLPRHARRLLGGYVQAMLDGWVDDAYVAHRRRAGRLHDAADLGADWYAAMYEVVRRTLVAAVRAAQPGAAELARFEDALARLVLVDLALLMDEIAVGRRAAPRRPGPAPSDPAAALPVLDPAVLRHVRLSGTYARGAAPVDARPTVRVAPVGGAA